MKLHYQARLGLFLILATLLLTSGNASAAELGLFLGQATGSLDTAFGKGMGIIALFAYLGAYAGFVIASWQIMQGKAEGAKFMIMGGLVAATASLIVKALFATGDTPITITPVTQ